MRSPAGRRPVSTDYFEWCLRHETEVKNMDVRDYEYIVTIADQGSITRAADQLFITQPALTKFLQRIEREVGLTLFIRKGKQFILTDAGRKYVDVGHEILRLDRGLTEHLSQEATSQKNRIRLGFSMGRFYDLMENVIPEFYRTYPDIRICAEADTSRKQFEALKKNELDMAVVTNVEQLLGYTYLPVEKSFLAVAAAEDAPLVSQGIPMEGYPFPVIDKAQLNGAPFVLLQNVTNSGHITRELFQKYEIYPNVILEMNNVRNVIDIVSQGIGVSMFMSVFAGSKRIRYLSLRDVEIISHTVYLVYRSDKALSAPMKHLISLILHS